MLDLEMLFQGHHEALHTIHFSGQVHGQCQQFFGLVLIASDLFTCAGSECFHGNQILMVLFLVLLQSEQLGPHLRLVLALGLEEILELAGHLLDFALGLFDLGKDVGFSAVFLLRVLIVAPFEDPHGLLLPFRALDSSLIVTQSPERSLFHSNQTQISISYLQIFLSIIYLLVCLFKLIQRKTISESSELHIQ